MPKPKFPPPEKFGLHGESQVKEFLTGLALRYPTGFTQKDYDDMLTAYKASLAMYSLRLVAPDRFKLDDDRAVTETLEALGTITEQDYPQAPVGFSLSEMDAIHQFIIEEQEDKARGRI